MFARALVRPPAPNCALGLSSSGLLPPDFGRALEQHRAYCLALRAEFATRRIGLEVMEIGAACRTYNVLVGEERRVLAALLLPGPPKGPE